MAHFACHGFADWSDPTRSHLTLRYGELKLTAITRMNLTRAELAYLSACSTSELGPRHADEAAHLTAAFHIAGYRQVIGTLWPVGDIPSAKMAEAVHAELVRGQSGGLALHHALLTLRERYRAAPLAWAGYHHVGV